MIAKIPDLITEWRQLNKELKERIEKEFPLGTKVYYMITIKGRKCRSHRYVINSINYNSMEALIICETGPFKGCAAHEPIEKLIKEKKQSVSLR